jgi:hypothetical protein
MIISVPTTARPQHRYDHRLRHLVQRTGDVTIATDHGVRRSTARGWLRSAPTVVVGLDVADLTEPEFRQEVLKLRRGVQKSTHCAPAIVGRIGWNRRLWNATFCTSADGARVFSAGHEHGHVGGSSDSLKLRAASCHGRRRPDADGRIWSGVFADMIERWRGPTSILGLATA